MHRARLESLNRLNLLRRLRTLDSATGPEVEMDGRRVLLFSSNNYLDLATHPRVVEAAIDALRRYGVGAGASRLIAGTLRPHRELEEHLAAFKRVEAALVFSTGYQTNLGLIQTLAEDHPGIYADRLCHASLLDACRLSKSTFRVFRHGDVAHVAKLLRAHTSRPPLIVTDGVFSMDGDLAPLPGLFALAQRNQGTLVVDDAHGTGVMGKEGRGTVEHFGLEDRPIVHMGTLSKAIGTFGGFVAGSHELIEYLVNRARAFIYTTALPPVMAAAATAALGVMEAEPERRAKLWRLRRRLDEGLHALGFDTLNSTTPIIPLLVGEPAAALRLAEHLARHGIYAPAIRPPTVPPGTSRIRLSVTAGHSTAQIDYLLEVLRKLRSSDDRLWEQLRDRSGPKTDPGRKDRGPRP